VAAYSEDQIKELIACPKTVSDPPKKEMRLFGADWRNDMTLTATNGTEGEFSVFMRKSEDFPENFSIGLKYQPNDGEDVRISVESRATLGTHRLSHFGSIDNRFF
jgi:hypothetical protein